MATGSFRLPIGQLWADFVYKTDNPMVFAEGEIEVEVENKKDYYWKIIAFDANGNSSSSGVYGFRTN